MSKTDVATQAIAHAMAELARAIDQGFPEKQREDLILLTQERQNTYEENVQKMRQEGERKRERAIRTHWHRY